MRTLTINEVLEIIDSVAVENMAQPIFAGKKSDGTEMTMAELANRNGLVAMHNEGIREMALMLKHRLLKGDETDDA